MQLKTLVLALSALCALPALAQQQITVVNFGGANANAQKKAYYEPFEKATGTKVIAVEYNGEQAKIKAMVETKKVTWDVVEVESPDAARGCDEGLFEKMDYSKLGGKESFLPAAVSECGVGVFVWSTVMAWNGDKLKDGPKTWADFWDTKKFPGKRGMRKGARYNLEFALMADGVKAADVYKAVNKVFLLNNGLPLPKTSLAALIYRLTCVGEVQSRCPKDAPNFDLLERNTHLKRKAEMDC